MSVMDSGNAQNPESNERVIDRAKVFAGGQEAKGAKIGIEREYTRTSLETGAELFLVTESTATGSSARKLAEAEADLRLAPDKPGAVMVLVRGNDSVGIAVSDATVEIPLYMFSTIEKPPGGRGEMPLPEYARRSAGELAAVFTRFYGSAREEGDVRRKGDKVLMGVLGLLILGIVAATALAFFWSRKRQGLPAG